MKYLSEFFVPYDSFFETNILLTSKLYKLNNFLLIFLSSKIMLFPLILILAEKNVKNFYSNFKRLIYTDKNT